MGAIDAGANWVVARADGPSGPDDRRSLGENLGPPGSRAHHLLHAVVQQTVLSCDAKGTRIPDGEILDHLALLRWLGTDSIVLMAHIKHRRYQILQKINNNKI
jgi:hypothetical protein